MIWVARWRIAIVLVFVAGLSAGVIWLTAPLTTMGPARAAGGHADAAPDRGYGPRDLRRPDPRALRTPSSFGETALTAGTPERVVVDAVSDWETFAAGGDLACLSRSFHEQGPQYRQFEREARHGAWFAIDADAAPSMAVGAVTVVHRAVDSAVVEAELTVSSAAAVERALWRFHLVVTPGSTWRVWTVELARRVPGERGPG